MDVQSNIIDLALTGKYSYQEMGNACNVSRQYVHQVLKKNGIDMAWSKQRLKDAYEEQIYGEAVEQVKQLYRSGVGINKVGPAAREVGVPLYIVKKLWTRTEDDDMANLRARVFNQTRREGECLIWTGNFGNGKPRFNHGGHSYAHYWTYYLTYGKPPQKGGRRTCGNNACVEPEHLK